MPRLAVVALAGALALAPAPALAEAPAPAGAGQAASGATVAAVFRTPSGGYHVRREPAVSVAAAEGRAAVLRRRPDVVDAGVDGTVHATADPYQSSQWGLTAVRAPEVWTTAPASGQVVAVVDSGVDLDHPDLAAALLPGEDLVDGDGTPDDANGHGTHVAGIVAAVAGNGIGGAGVAQGARVLPVRVLDANGAGSSADVAAGVRWAADHGATVVNLSLGSTSSSTLLSNAVTYALGKGITVVAAMGNDGSTVRTWPAAQTGVIAVGAVGRDDALAAFSNRGPHVALVAPGVDIVSTLPGGRYAAMSGTSMATPFVAGAAAVLRASAVPPSQVLGRLAATSTDLGPAGRDDSYGYGLLDLAAAVGALAPPTGTTSTVPVTVPSQVAVSRTVAGVHRVYLASQQVDGGGAVRSVAFGAPGDRALLGDWDGDGAATVGVWRPSEAAFYLGSRNVDGGGSVRRIAFGDPTDLPLAGRFGSDRSRDVVGVFRASTGTFYLASANTAGGGTVRVVRFASPGDLPLAGDWDGDGTTTVAVFRPSQGRFYLASANTTGGGVVTVVPFASPGDLPVSGDWRGEGRDRVGVFRPSQARFFLAGSSSAGGAPVVAVRFGAGTDRPLSYAGG